ncbi:MAG: hypothetical protein Q9159_000410 [Coniocarpon cinnabarinum]
MAGGRLPNPITIGALGMSAFLNPLLYSALESFGPSANTVVVLAVLLGILPVLRALQKACWTICPKVVVTDSDDFFESISEWSSESGVLANARDIQVRSAKKHLTELQVHPCTFTATSTVDDGLPFNFTTVQSRAKFRVELFNASTWILEKGSAICIKRSERSVPTDGGVAKSHESYEFTCLSLSPKTILQLFERIRVQQSLRHEGFTTVRRNVLRYDHMWVKAARRPCRSLGSVVLDQKTKLHVAEDMNKFFRMDTAQSYARRGIQYHRGYKFFGPPGSGKSSFAFALAGLFRVDLYILSLSDPTLTDSGLLTLVCALPDRCILLVEDVDAFEMTRSRTLPQRLDHTPAPASHLTLSGVLNAMDGNATHEGHILILTTNHPERLDSALDRAGRIDQHIQFQHADRSQMLDAFLLAYTYDDAVLNDEPITIEQACQSIVDMPSRVSNIPGKTMEELVQMAKEFTSKFCEHKHSVAAIQNYLGMKNTPEKALKDVDELATVSVSSESAVQRL